MAQSWSLQCLVYCVPESASSTKGRIGWFNTLNTDKFSKRHQKSWNPPFLNDWLENVSAWSHLTPLPSCWSYRSTLWRALSQQRTIPVRVTAFKRCHIWNSARSSARDRETLLWILTKESRQFKLTDLSREVQTRRCSNPGQPLDVQSHPDSPIAYALIKPSSLWQINLQRPPETSFKPCKLCGGISATNPFFSPGVN